MLNFRHTDGRVYNPARDILNLYKPVASTACHKLAEHGWHDAVRQWAAQTGLTEKDLVAGAVALAKFCNLVTSYGSTTVGDPWVNSGLAALPAPTLVALMFQLGVGFTSAFYLAAQNSVRQAQNAPGVDALGAEVDRLAHAVTAPTARARKRRVAASRGKVGPGDDL